MNYYLQARTLGKDKKIYISEEEYNDLKLACNTLSTFFDFTENYRVVVESYILVEKAKHDAELDHVLHKRYGYEDFSNVRVALSAPIVGYLASARYFLDSSDKILREILSESNIESFKKFHHNIYDSNREYRFIEALRNYAQHRNLPIHNITYHNFLEDKDSTVQSDRVTTLSLHAKKVSLKRDKKFKKAALEGMPETIDIIFRIRFHMEGIWKLFDYFYKSYSDIVDNARILVSNAIDKLKEVSGNDSLIFQVVADKSDKKAIDKTTLMLEWDDARRTVYKNLGDLINLHKHYITGKIQKA